MKRGMLKHVAAPNPVITTEEAQAVFELWARRKQEADALRQLPTPDDLAEAMGVTREEVDVLIQEIRQSRVVTPPPVLTPRKGRKAVWLTLGALAAFVFVLGMGYMMGSESARSRWAGGFSPAIARAHMQRLPAGLRAEYRGYTLLGEDQAHWDAAVVEANVLASLQSVVARMSPRPPFGSGRGVADEGELARALRGDEVPPALSDVLAFEPIELTLGAESAKVFVPVALTSDFQVNSMIEAERERRLQVAANRAARLVVEARAKPPTVAPSPR